MERQQAAAQMKRRYEQVNRGMLEELLDYSGANLGSIFPNYPVHHLFSD
jgi:hypothetical protein